jgi:hypothetical protein
LRLKSGIHADPRDSPVSEEPDFDVTHLCAHKNDSADFCEQEDFDLRAEAIPPDKISSFSLPDPSISSKYYVDCSLILPFPQDFEDKI